MKRVSTFTFRVNNEERRLISALAEILQRSQSDAVRWIVRQAANEFNLADNNHNIPPITTFPKVLQDD